MATDPIGWKDLFQLAGLLMTGVLVPLFLGIVVRKQTLAKDSIEGRMGRVETSIDGLGTAVFAKIDDQEDKIVKQFDSLCHERQDSCKALQDSKIRGVCTKLDAHKNEEEHRWTRQEVVNAKLEDGLLRP